MKFVLVCLTLPEFAGVCGYLPEFSGYFRRLPKTTNDCRTFAVSLTEIGGIWRCLPEHYIEVSLTEIARV